MLCMCVYWTLELLWCLLSVTCVYLPKFTPKLDLLPYGHSRVVLDDKILTALPLWLLMYSPVAAGSNHFISILYINNFPSSNLLVLSLAQILAYWTVMHSFLFCCTPIPHSFSTYNLSRFTLSQDLLLLWHTWSGFRWQDVMAFACLNIDVKPCVIQLRWFISVLYIKKLSRWQLSRNKLFINPGWFQRCSCFVSVFFYRVLPLYVWQGPFCK